MDVVGFDMICDESKDFCLKAWDEYFIQLYIDRHKNR